VIRRIQKNLTGSSSSLYRRCDKVKVQSGQDPTDIRVLSETWRPERT
jgi:hypothetical protein